MNNVPLAQQIQNRSRSSARPERRHILSQAVECFLPRFLRTRAGGLFWADFWTVFRAVLVERAGSFLPSFPPRFHPSRVGSLVCLPDDGAWSNRTSWMVGQGSESHLTTGTGHAIVPIRVVFGEPKSILRNYRQV